MTSGHLAELIERIAYEKGWSIREVARRSDLPPATVQKITWKRSVTVPRRETLDALAHGLGVPVAVLMEAAAQDAGLAAVEVDNDPNITIVVKAMQELSPQRRAEIAALARAMLEGDWS